MPAIITATQLRNVLGVSSALYDDTYLNQIIDSAENIILPMLVQNSSKVAWVQLKDNVAFYYTIRPHGFTTGQSIVISGLPSVFNGTKTVTNDYRFISEYTPQYGYPFPFLPAAVESAVYVVSTEIFQSRLSIGGQLEGVDFAPTPFRLGRSLLSRVQALLAPYLDVETMAQ